MQLIDSVNNLKNVITLYLLSVYLKGKIFITVTIKFYLHILSNSSYLISYNNVKIAASKF